MGEGVFESMYLTGTWAEKGHLPSADTKVLEIGECCTAMSMYLMPQSCILKNGWKGKFVYFNILFFFRKEGATDEKKKTTAWMSLRRCM